MHGSSTGIKKSSELLPAAQRSATIAQAQFTAIVAELLLTDPSVMEGAAPRLAALWRWHALEEIEHKAVAFDVDETQVGRGPAAYLLRAGGMLATTPVFLAMVLWFQQQLLRAEATRELRQGLGEFLRFMFWSPALLPALAKPWLAYLHRRFHPWNHDNRHLLGQLESLTLEIQPPCRAADRPNAALASGSLVTAIRRPLRVCKKLGRIPAQDRSAMLEVPV